ncbi:D-aminoacyl-tRNA deacylase [Legionella jordanis]|uniref:D-aminoacyl-tRNA deacylase n=1 Tax=Legionella jordanis TaxID=456 RepID=A0A0W0V9E0_9GAMM|nr:D-aminoacyl-tRNA deacylase [Legionella jordanis]KTD16692.1 D-tyrosyl-tRNA(Tyr) deacylase [Legionella jordanis]RMX03776.1 D-tyrosyl-tRNA(Tyr) deacylase [Legionella jordanis]RMX22163.1 D-tyrosyl-tRNA(Tyr) deacylase [Legionella jordanis]VEH11840.1 D-tyrosyl-tRNA(Tyr) deacylase [Legionella jordanis]HAT8712851.1 D-tyrosyl-tRNA(Tyr) deacylase [Legionella jordanis]
MLTVLQRVLEARVDVAGKTIAAITQGLLILCGFETKDDVETLNRMLEKCLNYRIFSDSQGKLNLSLKDIQGGLLLVPQFTLVADTKKGLRPSFSSGASPARGQALFEQLLQLAKQKYPWIAQGQFGADMQVILCNDGPVTFILEF